MYTMDTRLGILIAFLTLLVIVPIWIGILKIIRGRRTAETDTDQLTSIPTSLQGAAADFALGTLAAAAPHLFELRKVGLFMPISPSVRKALLAVDLRRAQRVLAIVDGTARAETESWPAVHIPTPTENDVLSMYSQCALTDIDSPMFDAKRRARYAQLGAFGVLQDGKPIAVIRHRAPNSADTSVHTLDGRSVIVTLGAAGQDLNDYTRTYLALHRLLSN
jgi:hypothetical protein